MVGNGFSMPETFGERSLEQDVGVDRAEDLVYRLPRRKNLLWPSSRCGSSATS